LILGPADTYRWASRLIW